ncbi:retrotransposon protein, putative, ty1-copia subclass [Tanacetum coccineum]
MGLQLFLLELRLGKTPSRSFWPVKSLNFLWQIWTSQSSKGFHFAMIVLGTRGSPPCGCVVNPLVDFLVLVMAYETKHRIVLGNEQKLHHLEKALPESPPATSTATTAIRNAYTRRVAEQQEVACLMLQQAEQELFETVKAFHAYKQEEGQFVSTYVLKMKAYLDQIKRLGYPMPLVLVVNLILTSLSKDYDQFVQNYNMYGIGKTIPELHAMIKLAEKSIPKKAPAVLVIRQGIKSLHLLKKSILLRTLSVTTVIRLDTRRGAVHYIGSVKKNKVGTSGTSATEYKHNLDSTFLWHCRLGHINKKRIEKLQHDGLLKSIDEESFYVCVSCISGKMARKPFTYASERADDLLGIIHSDVCGPFRTMSRECANYYVTFSDDFSRYESAARILNNMVPTKKVNKTPYEMWHGKVPNLSCLKVWGCEALVNEKMRTNLSQRSTCCILCWIPLIGYSLVKFYYPLENKIFVARYAEFFYTNLIKQEASGSTVNFDDIQREDAQPSENTSLHQHEVEHDAVDPQTDVILVHRFARIPQAPERYGFYIDAEEHKLGDHGEPLNFQAALSDPESKKWLEAMNAEMQSMKDNQVWNLVDITPRVLGSLTSSINPLCIFSIVRI